jgi:hypothetical protein
MIAGFAALLLAACATPTGPPPMTSAQVDSIQKGATTRAQIDAMFGPPISISIVDNGDRVASYRTRQVDYPAVNPAGFIPLAGPIIVATSSDNNTTVRRQTLQVRYTPSGVVQDYEFLDTTAVYDSDGNLLRRDATLPTAASGR